MLEHTCLIVHPWTPDAACWLRHVSDQTGVLLGCVRHEGAERGSWFSWLRKIKLDVFETEDASHLMALHRAWGMRRSWHVHDAEDLYVGTLHWGSLASSDGVTLGDLEGDSDSGQIIDSAGTTLASYRKNLDAAVAVTFAKDAMGNPFLRMLLLGSILVLEPAPN